MLETNVSIPAFLKAALDAESTGASVSSIITSPWRSTF